MEVIDHELDTHELEDTLSPLYGLTSACHTWKLLAVFARILLLARLSGAPQYWPMNELNMRHTFLYCSAKELLRSLTSGADGVKEDQKTGDILIVT